MFRPPFLLLSLFLNLSLLAQSPIHESLDTLNVGSVEYIHPENMAQLKDVVVLDAREKEEFEVSHLENAIWVGYSDFDVEKTNKFISEKNKPIVVYCSIGARSEDIGEKLEQAGYKNVKNLFGGIFLWKNLGYPVFDESNQETEKVHTFSKEWAPLLTNGYKVYTTKKDTLE